MTCQNKSLIPLQVRPKTQIPDSLPHSPCQDLQPLSLQRATAVLSPRVQAPPTATHQPNGKDDAPSGASDSGPAQHPPAGAGVAYAIIAASPASGHRVSAVGEAVKVSLTCSNLSCYCALSSVCRSQPVSQTQLTVIYLQVIIIQPQTPSCTDGSPGVQADPPAPPKSPPQRKEEDPEVSSMTCGAPRSSQLLLTSCLLSESGVHGGPGPGDHRAAGG